MNKTVTFNLNGLVFTIEETGYERLRTYLEAVQQYLMKLQEGHDILREVEARMAEKFKDILSKDDRMILTAEDVNLVMSEMGSPEEFSDFSEEDEEFQAAEKPKASQGRRLSRLQQGKVLGGVAKGLAAYLGLDVLAVRILFVLAFVVFAGYGFIIYLILWVSLPADAADLPETRERGERRRLYRSADEQVMGGVASGMAAYLRVDPVVVRLLFIFALFWGGFGLLAYVLLWIATPKAETLTQKVEMRGQAPNIENLSRAGQQKDEFARTSQTTFERLLLVPVVIFKKLLELAFRLLKVVFGFGRIFLGAFIMLLAAVFLFGFGTSIAAVFAAYMTFIPTDLPIPLEGLTGSTSSDIGVLILLLFFLLLPILAALYLGIRLLFNRKLFRRKQLLMGGSAWLATVLLLILFGLRTAGFFQHEASFTHRYEAIKLPSNRLFVELKSSEQYSFPANIRFKTQATDSLLIRETVRAHGRNAEEAEVWASMAYHPVKFTSDSSVLLTQRMLFLPGAKFRGQSGNIDFVLPENTRVQIPRKLSAHILNKGSIWRPIDARQEYYEFVVRADGLHCLNCRSLESPNPQTVPEQLKTL